MGRPLSQSPAYDRLSFWHETAGSDWTPRPSLPGDLRRRRRRRRRRLHRAVDRLLPGRGRPDAADRACSRPRSPGTAPPAATAAGAPRCSPPRSPPWPRCPTGGGALAQHRAMRETVDEVARVAAAEGIDAHLAKGGTIALARNRAQWRRARDEVRDAREWARGDDDLRLLDAREATSVLAGAGTVGATYTPDCAAIHPGRLVRGLAEAVERRGVQIYERTRASAIEAGRVRTDARRGPGRDRGPGHRGLHPDTAGPGPRRGARLLAGDRDRAAVGRDLAPDRAGPAGDVHRPPPPDRLRTAHRRRPDRLRRPRRAVPRRLPGPAGVRPRRARLHEAVRRPARPVPGPGRDAASPTPGAVRSASPATGAPRSGWTDAPAWAGPAATSATA